MKDILYCNTCKSNKKVLKKRIIENKIFRDKEYSFRLTHYICKDCQNEIQSEELLKLNQKEMEDQYRYFEGIVTIEQIEQCMELYNLGKAPLSLALGLGEITITRYCQGQMPSKVYADRILNVLHDFYYMEDLLIENKNKVGSKAFEKGMESIQEYKELFNQNKKLLGVLSILYRNLIYVDGYSIYILLYHIEGIYGAIFNKDLFLLNCYATKEGIAYTTICDLIHKLDNPIYRNFLISYEDSLNKYEKYISKLVCETFGMLSYTSLKNLVQQEYPYVRARCEYYEFEQSNVKIEFDIIQNYFIKMNDQYNLDTATGIQNYIKALICNEKEKSE